MPVKELRDELRTLRKESIKPVSKMGFKDISAEIERLKVSREETPPVASTGSGSLKKKEAAGVVEPVSAEEAVQKVKVKSIATATRKSKKSKLESVKDKEKEKNTTKKTISPEHLAKMKAGRLAKKV